MTYNETIKSNIMRWRAKNKEYYNLYVGIQNQKFRDNNRDAVNKQRMEYYYINKDPFLREAKIFRKILL